MHWDIFKISLDSFMMLMVRRSFASTTFLVLLLSLLSHIYFLVSRASFFRIHCMQPMAWL